MRFWFERRKEQISFRYHQQIFRPRCDKVCVWVMSEKLNPNKLLTLTHSEFRRLLWFGWFGSCNLFAMRLRLLTKNSAPKLSQQSRFWIGWNAIPPKTTLFNGNEEKTSERATKQNEKTQHLQKTACLCSLFSVYSIAWMKWFMRTIEGWNFQQIDNKIGFTFKVFTNYKQWNVVEAWNIRSLSTHWIQIDSNTILYIGRAKSIYIFTWCILCVYFHLFFRLPVSVCGFMTPSHSIHRDE